jgi:poly(ADP-ribose) glycohydrolase ARH3
MNNKLQSKFAGCLLGAMIGDVIGAVVEAESPGYIRKTFSNVDDLLKLARVEELFEQYWTVGKYTDDTQMLLAVTDWLLHDDTSDGKALLGRLSESFEPWRRYGPATQRILTTFKEYPEQWRGLAECAYSGGSYGNGSAIRVAPVGLRFYNNLNQLIKVASLSSRVTHSHPLAIQGSVLQALAVSTAVRTEGPLDAERVFTIIRFVLSRLRQDYGYSDDVFVKKLNFIEEVLGSDKSTDFVIERIGTGVEVYESMPFALFCALSFPDSFEDAVSMAVFSGGDTDSVACMTGAISGALLGEEKIPMRWVEKIQEDDWSPTRIRELALLLAEKASDNAGLSF